MKSNKPKKEKAAKPLTDKILRKGIKALESAKPSEFVSPNVEEPREIPNYKPKITRTIYNCLICNDPVANGDKVYNYPCHAQCANASGDKIIRARIREINNG